MSSTRSETQDPQAAQQTSRSRILASFDTLRIAPFRFLLAENGITMMAFQARLMAQAWLVLSLTDSDSWVGAVNGIPAIPVALLALFGGVMADRLDRKRMLVWTRLSLATLGLLTAFVVSTDVVAIWHLIVLASFTALAQTFGVTLNQTMMVDTVGRRQLFSANAMYGATFNLSMFGGPAIGGILIARVGVDAAFYLIAGLLVLAAIAASQIRVSRAVRAGERGSFMEDLKDGLRYISATPALRWLTVMSIMLAFGGIIQPLMPRYARDVLGAGAQGYGILLSAQGVGGLVGVVSLIIVSDVRSLAKIMVACTFAFAVLTVVFAFSTSLVLSSAVTFGFGFIIVWWGNSMRVAFQLTASDEMRGRVMSLFGMTMQMLTLSWLLGGVLSDLIGPKQTMIGGIVLCASVYALAYLRSPELRAVGR